MTTTSTGKGDRYEPYSHWNRSGKEHVFQRHSADERGRKVWSKQLKRGQVLAFFANHRQHLVKGGTAVAGAPRSTMASVSAHKSS
ncbi:hypothetical protein EO087_01020 [Dyella sp. M7H15-1]|nr:hypothetical protein EO087_01020 [Dyella sp. M7H15-1]